MNHFTKCAFFALAAASIAACSGGGGSTPAPKAATPLYLGYTAIGASDAVGYGATVPCTVASPALVADPTCPEAGASGYVPDIVRGFAKYGFVASLNDRGISGAVVGPDVLAIGNAYGTITGPTPCAPRTGSDVIPGDFVTNELPNVSSTTTFVTIFAGGNDVNAIVNALACGAGGTTTATQTAFVTKAVTAFGQDFGELVAGVHAKAPGAIIAVANIPNFANVPYALAQPAAVRGALQAVSVAIDTNVINTVYSSSSGAFPVIDLQCDPNSYVASNFYTDGFHPNDTGYGLLAAKFLAAALSPTTTAAPAATCSQQAIMGSVRTNEPMAVGHALGLPRY